MANTRIMSNNTGHDRTGIKRWKWEQARECLVDPCVSPATRHLPCARAKSVNLPVLVCWFECVSRFGP